MSTIICKFQFFLLVFLLTTLSSFSQEQEILEKKGIILTKKGSSSTVFLPENKRIKVKLVNGAVFVGRLKIIDDKTFSIKDNVISLGSIVKIKKRTVVATIIAPIIVYLGAGFVAGGILVVALGETYGIGYFISAIGITGIIAPLATNGHRVERWSYSIGENPKNKKPIPN
jgi:small nuclear ribonucleoprotein (snRNP)-like protein